MRFSQTFSATLRKAPAAVSLPSQQWLTRAGFIRALTTNQFAFLPLAQRAIARIEAILRETLGSLDSQELYLPGLHANSAEGTITYLTEQIVQSYRQLPQLIHHFHLALTGDRGPGLFSLPEVTAVTCYTLAADQTGLENQTQAIVAAFQKALQSCGLSVQIALSEDDNRVFVCLTDSGPAPILSCDTCTYAAEQSTADSRKPDASPEALLPVEKVATPEMTSIASLAGYLDIPSSRTAKAVFYTGIFEGTQDSQRSDPVNQNFQAPVQGDQDFLATEAGSQEPLLIFAMLRGDRTLSEPKLRQALNNAGKGRLVRLQPALESEIQAVGAVPGYASPIGIRQDKALVVADQALLASPNLVAGANEIGYHLCNTNLGRDYEPDIIADIAQVEPGEPCPHCPGHLALHQGVVLGHYGKVNPGSNPTFLDEHGAAQPIHLGRFEVWIEPVLTAVTEDHHDDAGLIWPMTIAPYPIHLVALPSKDGAAETAAEKLYQDLIAANLAPLYDDRAERAGVKFNDADLIGLPLRITVSSRSLENGGYEFKRRDGEERWIVPVEDCITSIQDELHKLQL